MQGQGETGIQPIERFSSVNSQYLNGNNSLMQNSGIKAEKLVKPLILLVEDYPANLLVATTYLDNLGHEYEIAHNGKEAVEKYANDEFGLILMDVQMPEMDGYEATKIIRERESKGLNSYTPIIAMTSHVRIEDRQRCIAAGMDEYISKPFREEELKQVIEKFQPGVDIQ